jgi:hypothetical protein
MSKKPTIIPIERIENRIYLIRGQKVMLDTDLAILFNNKASRSQIVTLKRGQNIKYPPFAFTEHSRDLRLIFAAIRKLMESPLLPREKPRRIGFVADREGEKGKCRSRTT